MQFIEPPHQILRGCLIQGLRYTSTANHIASFLASTLLGTSGIVLPGEQWRLAVAKWSLNTGMTGITEQVVFTDPYKNAQYNRWTTPYLDEFATAIRNDDVLKLAAQHLKTIFITKTQALIHGDLHTGSIMVCENSTFVIDPEFAFYGPMGFDTGALLANYLLAYFSHSANQGDEYAEWVIQQTIVIFEEFEFKFLELWDSKVAAGTNGELYPVDIFPVGNVLKQAQEKFLLDLWMDTIGFAGMKIIRRIVGVAHVADLETIQDLEKRANCEKRALYLGRELVISSHHRGFAFDHQKPDAIQAYRKTWKFGTIQKLVDYARLLYHAEPPQKLFSFVS